jgi:hypothetical protein
MDYFIEKVFMVIMFIVLAVGFLGFNEELLGNMFVSAAGGSIAVMMFETFDTFGASYYEKTD